MPHHEIKYCPRCRAQFECKPGDIAHCQCFGIVLNNETQDMIARLYADCLCRKCLLELSQATNANEKESTPDIAF